MSLDLSNNQITDLAPLIGNVGIGTGAVISLAGNPIDCTAQQGNIAMLQGRGVTMYSDCP